MKQGVKTYLFLGLLTFLLGACSNDDALPKSCIASNFHFTTRWLLLTGANRLQPKLFLLHNHSQQRIELEHPMKHPSASAGWSSFLEAGRYSAFVSTHSSFAWSCRATTHGKSYQIVPCSAVLSVCQFSSVRWAQSPGAASFWAESNVSLESVLKTLHQRHINP